MHPHELQLKYELRRKKVVSGVRTHDKDQIGVQDQRVRPLGHAALLRGILFITKKCLASLFSKY